MSSLSNVLANELKGKTVRVMTKSGFSMQGRVVEYDREHMNIVLDCIDGTVAIVSNNNNNSNTNKIIQQNPPHIANYHREIFIRGSSIRWMEIEEHQNLSIQQ